jgi:hypothetical protein
VTAAVVGTAAHVGASSANKSAQAQANAQAQAQQNAEQSAQIAELQAQQAAQAAAAKAKALGICTTAILAPPGPVSTRRRPLAETPLGAVRVARDRVLVP